MVKLESFTDKMIEHEVPTYFLENFKKILQSEEADWFDADNHPIKSCRTIEDSGLTTIIPSLQEPKKQDQWDLKVAYATIYSYFRLFETNQMEVIVEDEFSGENKIINHSNYKRYLY